MTDFEARFIDFWSRQGSFAWMAGPAWSWPEAFLWLVGPIFVGWLLFSFFYRRHKAKTAGRMKRRRVSVTLRR